MELNFIPIDYSYFDWKGKNYLRIIGRNDKGKRICIVDSFQPYLYAILKPMNARKIEKLKKKISKIKINSAARITKIEKINLEDKNFLGKKVRALKIFMTNYKDAHSVADNLALSGIIARREYDLSLTTKYIIDKQVIPLSWYKVTGELLNNSLEFGGLDSSLDVDICLKAEKIEPTANKNFSPKTLAFDIESDELQIGKGEILMISLVSDNFKKVLTWKKCKKQDYVECFKDEAEMLEAFVNYIKELQPDLLVGYFSDGFDLPYLRARAEKNKINLSIGIDGKQPTFARGRLPSAKVSGIQHVDLFRFIETVYSQYLKSETLSLDDVASELLGERKKQFNPARKIKDHEWKDFFEYNLQDSILTYKLAEKFWPDMLEFSKILQEPLFDITRSGMSQIVEYYILHNLNKYNEIAEKRPIHEEISKRRMRKRYEGAFVLQPEAALYEDIVIFDFTSYWPSIIVTFNLSRSTFLEKKQKNSLEVDIGKKVYFTKKSGFFPEMLKDIIKKRKKYKEEYKKSPDPIKRARSNAYKLLANASYGYQGFFGARYYCPEASASATAISRDFTKKTIDKLNKKNYSVIYSDTDSIAMTLNKHSKKDALKTLKEINEELPGIMELDLEDFYKRGIWVTKRTGGFGAKKKYALINEKGKLKIRGFETVRRDWCQLARNLQNKILERILKDGNEKKALEIVKETIIKIKNREIDKKQIIIKTQLKKPLEEYKAITPHVIAARKIKESGEPIDMGMLIEYFIAETREKKSLVREKVKLLEEKGEYNIKYYLERQILPAVENIFEVFDIKIKEVMKETLEGKRQTKLDGF